MSVTQTMPRWFECRQAKNSFFESVRANFGAYSASASVGTVALTPEVKRSKRENIDFSVVPKSRISGTVPSLPIRFHNVKRNSLYSTLYRNMTPCAFV